MACSDLNRISIQHSLQTTRKSEAQRLLEPETKDEFKEAYFLDRTKQLHVKIYSDWESMHKSFQSSIRQNPATEREIAWYSPVWVLFLFVHCWERESQLCLMV